MDVPFIGGFFTNTRGQQYGPFVRKKKLKKATGSGILTDPMAKAPRGARGKQVIRKRTGFPKRQPVKRTSSKRKRLAPRGKFKKPKKVRKIATHYHNHRYEVEGTCNAAQPYMYIGVNDCYKRTAVWDAIADALIRPILKREFKFVPQQDSDKLGFAQLGSAASVLLFDFRRVNGIGGAKEDQLWSTSDALMALNRVDCDNVTYDVIRTRMSAVLQYWADGVVSATPAADTVAYFPFAYSVSSNGATSVVATVDDYMVTRFEHLGDTMIDLVFKQKTMFVNRTKAEGGGTAGDDLDRLGTNPLKGKLYQFNSAVPRILDHTDMSVALRTLIQSDPPSGMDKYESSDAADSHLAHPLSSKFWLKNCSKESDIMLQPGQTKSHSTVYKLKGRLSTLIERFYFAGFDKGTFGSSSLFMFDMVHKSDQTPATTYKRTCIVQSAGKLKSPRMYIPDFEAVTENL